MAEFEWPEVVEQTLSTGVFIDEGMVVFLYAPVGDDPDVYPSQQYKIEKILSQKGSQYRVKLQKL